LKNKRIRDEHTNCTRRLATITVSNSLHSIGVALNPACEYESILAEYPALTNPNFVINESPTRTEHHILTTGPPVHSRARRLPPDRLEAAKKEFQQMLDAGTIRVSKSPWASPLLLVSKSNGEFRPCGDYRRLNAVTTPDRFPIPHLQDFSANLHGAKIFSKIDIAHAFHQIPMVETSIQKTAVITPFGLFEFTTMPYGLRNAPQTFQRHMSNILSDLTFTYTYLDDVLIASESPEQHKDHLRAVFDRLSAHGLLINPAKCELGRETLTYLGHHISQHGLKPLPCKVDAIRKFPKPETQRQLRRFLGSVNFYHRFIKGCAQILAPLSALLSPKHRGKSTLIVWNEEAAVAFDTIKERLAITTELSYPTAGAEFSLVVDASDVAVGAVLQQTVGSLTSSLAFFSKKLSPTEQRYSAFGRELLAIYLAVRHFRYTLEARHFVIYTDHKPLIAAIHMPSDRHSPRESRHLSFISQFTTDLRHIKGTDNTVADCLSRIHSISVIPVVEQLTLESIVAAQKEDPELQELLKATQNTFQMSISSGAYCDADRPNRLYLPMTLRRAAIAHYHALSHPGIERTLRLIAERYVWPSMRKDVKHYVQHCHDCQASKVTKHNRAALQTCAFSGNKFDSVHLDLTGPLPTSRGYSYLLTMVDRFSRWVEAIPIPDIKADTVARTFVHSWKSRFGVPLSITYDRGAQFSSKLWSDVSSLLGCANRSTTAFHPQSNGLIERVHRDIKSALKCLNSRLDWVDHLPMILLSLQNLYKQDQQATTSEMMYGQSLRLPGDIVNPKVSTSFLLADQNSYSERLKQCMRQIRYVAPRPTKTVDKLDPALQNRTHVYVRVEGIKPALTRPYDGPFRVIKGNPKYFTIEKSGKHDSISIDRLKAAFASDALLP
ncbi:Reverse transcriptase domain, partial [Trinorchestia longiramus]